MVAIQNPLGMITRPLLEEDADGPIRVFKTYSNDLALVLFFSIHKQRNLISLIFHSRQQLLEKEKLD